MVKEFLSQKGIAYEERDISINNAYAREMVQKTGQMGVPVTFIGDTAVIGFDRSRLEQLVPLMQRPLFGAAIADAGPIMQKRGSGPTSGAYIGRIKPGSIAERMGLMPGDIITDVNARRIIVTGDFERAYSGLNSGASISISFLRGNETKTVNGTI